MASQSTRPDRLRSVDTVIAVASGKGGVGKSTVAAAVAVGMIERGLRVGLLDSDLFGPSLPTLFDLHDAQLGIVSDQQVSPFRLPNGLQVVSFGFVLGEAPAVMRGPMVSRYIDQLLSNVEWDDLDLLILDLPPGTGDAQLTITQTIALDGAIIVTNPHPLSFADVGKAILMFEKVSVPIIGVVENLAWFECPACTERHSLFASPGVQAHSVEEQIATRFGIPIIGRLPLDPVRYGGVFGHREHDPLGDEVEELIDNILSTLQEKRRAIVPRVSLEATGLTLSWEDGEQVSVGYRELRAACRCAICENRRDGTRRLSPETIPSDIQATETRSLGNYALYIQWSDGHATGFFPYQQIRALAQDPACL